MFKSGEALPGFMGRSKVAELWKATFLRKEPMSFAIASHAVRMLWLNLQDALRLTAVPYLVVQAISIGLPLLVLGAAGTEALGDFTLNELDDGTPTGVEMPENLGMVVIVQVLAVVGSIIAGAWLAVVWHRFVLLEEYPNGAVPPFQGDLVTRYVLRLVVIFCVMIGIGLVGGLATAMFAAIVPFVGVVMGAGLIVVMILFSVRLSVMLPAAAVGIAMGVSEAWNKTQDSQWSLFGGTVLIAILSTLLAIPALILMYVFGVLEATEISVIQIAINVVFGWIATMLTVSLATTIYGVAVEGRELT